MSKRTLQLIAFFVALSLIVFIAVRHDLAATAIVAGAFALIADILGAF